MLEKINVPFAVSVLTKDAKLSLLNNNIEFELKSFAFIDDEVNYNLINPDQSVTVATQTERGLNRIDTEQADIVGGIESISVFDPSYRTDNLRNFLFGDTVKHNLLPSQIKNTDDVIRDIIGAPITAAREIPATQRVKKLDFQTTVITGNFSDFYLTSNNLLSWSAALDIRGVMTLYQSSGTIVMVEDGTMYDGTQQLQVTDGFQPYDDISYVVQFIGDATNKMFTYTQKVAPFEPLTISAARIVSDQKLSYELYGQFTIYKQFLFQGKTYKSAPIEFRTIKENAQNEVPNVLDGKAQILDLYTSPHDRKNVFVHIPIDPEQVIVPKVYGNSLVDSVLAQQRLPGYIKATPVIHLMLNASKMNTLTLQLQNINTSTTYNLLSMFADQVVTNGFVTVQELNLSLWIYKHLLDDGYHLFSRLDPVSKYGYLSLDDTTYEGKKLIKYEYSLFGEKRYKLYLDLQSDIFLGPQPVIETANEFQSLYHLHSPDQNLVFNFPFQNELLMTDYENLIISTAT